MQNKIHPETFRLVAEAIANIKAELKDANTLQLMTAAVVLAKIRIRQGMPVPYGLCDVSFETLSAPNYVVDRSRDALVDFLLNT
jgi:hypothetical protein